MQEWDQDRRHKVTLVLVRLPDEPPAPPEEEEEAGD